MKTKLKHTLACLAVVCALNGPGAYAQGIPVIDAANLAQAAQQVSAWAKQYSQMVSQLQQMQAQYNALTGIRNMGQLVNNPLARKYLPDEYRTMVNNGYGAWRTIEQTNRRLDFATAKIDPASALGVALLAASKQAAVNAAASEEAYRTAGARFNDIQILMDKIDGSPDAKDIADLQARIQAEQVMMQNEANRLQALALTMQGQEQLAVQRDRERRVQSMNGGIPRW